MYTAVRPHVTHVRTPVIPYGHVHIIADSLSLGNTKQHPSHSRLVDGARRAWARRLSSRLAHRHRPIPAPSCRSHPLGLRRHPARARGGTRCTSTRCTHPHLKRSRGLQSHDLPTARTNPRGHHLRDFAWRASLAWQNRKPGIAPEARALTPTRSSLGTALTAT